MFLGKGSILPHSKLKHYFLPRDHVSERPPGFQVVAAMFMDIKKLLGWAPRVCNNSAFPLSVFLPETVLLPSPGWPWTCDLRASVPECWHHRCGPPYPAETTELLRWHLNWFFCLILPRHPGFKFLFCCYDKIPWLKQHRGKGAYLTHNSRVPSITERKSRPELKQLSLTCLYGQGQRETNTPVAVCLHLALSNLNLTLSNWAESCYIN